MSGVSKWIIFIFFNTPRKSNTKISVPSTLLLFFYFWLVRYFYLLINLKKTRLISERVCKYWVRPREKAVKWEFAYKRNGKFQTNCEFIDLYDKHFRALECSKVPLITFLVIFSPGWELTFILKGLFIASSKFQFSFKILCHYACIIQY